MSQKDEQKEKSHDAILASAAALLRKQGIKASSVTEVMKGAGLTVGGFYGHFDSKEHLFAETIHRAAGAMWSQMLSIAKGDSPSERAKNVLRRYLSRSHRDSPEEGCILPSVAAEVAREGEPYRSALEQEIARIVDSLAEMLKYGPRRKETALGLIALMYGGLSLSRALAGTPLSDDFLNAARALGKRAVADEDEG